MDKKMKLTKLERQLKLYEILLPCTVHFRDWGELKEFKEIMDKAVSLSQSTLTDQEAI